MLSGRWVALHWNLGFAALMCGLMLIAYVHGLMGGGDVKLLAVAFLWTGIHCAALFLLALTMLALLHALAARLGWVAVQRDNGRMRIPFAPSVAADSGVLVRLPRADQFVVGRGPEATDFAVDNGALTHAG